MPAPIVIRLTEQIASSREPEERAVYQAALASYFARVGQYDDAEALRAELRRDFGDGRSLRVAVRLMCLEALLLYYRDLSPLSRDRLARANVLARASRDPGLMALTSSWLAHIDFNLNKFESMADALAECFSAIGPADAEAEGRAATVLGDAYMYVGERKWSRQWYERARQKATSVGDQAAIGALTYNPAALHVASLRLLSLEVPVRADELAMVATEVRSAINYQLAAGLSSLDHLLHTARVGVLVLERRFADAAKLAGEVLDKERIPTGSAQELLLRADLAAALAQSGRPDASEEWLDQVPLDRVRELEPDDRALILDSLSLAHAHGGSTDLANELHDGAIAALHEHRSGVARVRATLEHLSRRLPPVPVSPTD